MIKEDLMRRAIYLARESVANGGGPFGAVIARDGAVISEAANSVTVDNDPTAHAEVNAIRLATQRLGTFDLSGCEIYASCEPCPMCLGAIYWARLDRIYYAADREDAAGAGFSDDFIYKEMQTAPSRRDKPMLRLLASEARCVFDLWRSKSDKIEY